jgi:hypothetical protein
MSKYDADRLILIVTGSTIRAEDKDRPLACTLRREILERLPDDTDWQCVVISDLYYLNNTDLHACPTISIGGPGVNHLAQVFYADLPAALTIDGVLQIQMDVKMADHRASIWGMDHDTTVDAVDTFIHKGHLDRFLSGILPDELA